jgi:hypothetical protein
VVGQESEIKSRFEIGGRGCWWRSRSDYLGKCESGVWEKREVFSGGIVRGSKRGARRDGRRIIDDDEEYAGRWMMGDGGVRNPGLPAWFLEISHGRIPAG